jgi:hypothetical protein
MNIDQLLQRVRERSGLKSIRAISRLVGIDPDSWIDYRNGTLPSDDTMMRLCLIGGIEPEEGLLLLNIWRSKGRARAMYSRIYKIWNDSRAVASNKAGSETRSEQIHV